MTSTDPTPGLPPVPGPTGEPRPPEPPFHDVPRRLRTIVTHLDPRDTTPRWRLGPPDEPPLELAVVNPAERWKEALLITTFYAAVLLLLSVLWGWGDLDRWLFALKFFGACLVPLCGVFWRNSDAHGWAVAGGSWLATGRGRRPSRRRRRRPATVCLYTLGKVEATYGESVDPAPDDARVLLLMAREQPTPTAVGGHVSMLEANPALWALVYNGILHSEAHGAVINDRTREFLHLEPN